VPSPILVASTDHDRRVLVMTVEGALLEAEHTRVLREALPVLPTGYGLIVDLTGPGSDAPAALEGLRALARDAVVSGQTLVFVCADLDRRSGLVLADLDSLVPVVAALEHAIPLAHRAA